MPKFVKKPVIIEAVQWTGDNKLDISEFVQDSERKYDFKGDALFIHTLEGSMRASKGDYIIKGVEVNFILVSQIFLRRLMQTRMQLVNYLMDTIPTMSCMTLGRYTMRHCSMSGVKKEYSILIGGKKVDLLFIQI